MIVGDERQSDTQARKGGINYSSDVYTSVRSLQLLLLVSFCVFLTSRIIIIIIITIAIISFISSDCRTPDSRCLVYYNYIFFSRCSVYSSRK